MEKLKLVKPALEHEIQVMKIREDFFKNNEEFSGCAGLEDVNSYSEWINFEERLSKKYGNTYVPSEVYLCIRETDNKIVGIIDYRTRLSEFLLKFGGNIGYSIVIDERRKGYAKEMLKLMLEKCKSKNAEKVLITCDKANIASSKTIIANGGILENEIPDLVGIGHSGIVQRYWINLKKEKNMEDKKILICDDAAFMRMMLKDIIEKMGFLKSNIYEAEDGKICVEKYNDVKPDVVLMDITMPVMDGITAMKEILKENPKAKIIILSAMGQQENVKEALKAGAKEFVVKPFKRDNIEEIIKKVIGEE